MVAISSVDGRYRDIAASLSDYGSEYARIRARVGVECEYLIALSHTRKLGLRTLEADEEEIVRALEDVSLEDARTIKKIEKEGFEGIPATNHDVKAIEYFLKWKLKGTSLEDVLEWIHFALTSEDVDNLGDTLLLRGALQEVILPALEELRTRLEKMAREHAARAMLARTHGQSASPTTFGKEVRVFEARLARQIEQLRSRKMLVKWGGATGNFNAHTAGAPEIEWPRFARNFISYFNKEHEIKLEYAPATTQIVPYDTYAEVFDNLRRGNTVLIDFAQDMWRYVSDGWIAQKPKVGEVGSSTMPHKVNPIDFENAEGNLGVANALFEHFSRKLPISRLQRDLSDSTVKRTFGTALAHSLIGYKALLRGLGKISVNRKAMLSALEQHPEVLAEAIQTILRREGVEVPYEKLKDLTRGKQVTLDDFAKFIDGLDIKPEVKKRLKALRPETYIGIAEKLARG